eukprot:m51a1_g9590 putative tyrosine-protein kinase fes fps (658) ;mRNA; f:1019538-1022221
MKRNASDVHALCCAPSSPPPSGPGVSAPSAPAAPESQWAAAHKRARTQQRAGAVDGPSSEPASRSLALPDLRALLLHASIDSAHAAELAERMMANRVDTMEAIAGLDEAQMFFLGATIGDQAKLRAVCRRRAAHRVDRAGPGFASTSTESSADPSTSRSFDDASEGVDTFVNGPVAMLRDVAPRGIIGKGAFGVVMSGVWGAGATPVALKSTVANAPEDVRQGLIIEASMLSSLRHPNVIQMYGVAMHAGAMYLVTELADGNLLTLLRSANLPLSSRLRICRDVAAGMQFLASNKVIHRDLACRNVLYQGMTPVVKISDFGLSRIRWGVANVNDAVDSRMTVRWTPPESYTSSQWSEKSDVWSMGVLIWEVMTNGGRPWDGLNTEQIKAVVNSGARLLQPVGCPDQLYAVMLRCWEFDAARRPSFGQICRALNDMFMRTLENPLQPDFSGIVLQAEPDAGAMDEDEYDSGEVEVCAYHVNAKDTIIFVEQPVWDKFLEANSATSLVGTIVGRPIWDFVSGAATQHLYRLVLRKVRETGRPVTFPFRCDSPHERRYLEMQVLPLPCRCVQFRSVTHRVERRVSVQLLLDSETPRDESLPPVPMCSLCKRVRMGPPGSQWLEVEDALAAGLLGASVVLPPLLHDCCDGCFRRVAARIPQ